MRSPRCGSQPIQEGRPHARDACSNVSASCLMGSAARSPRFSHHAIDGSAHSPFERLSASRAAACTAATPAHRGHVVQVTSRLGLR